MVVYKTTNLLNNKIYVGIDTHNNPTYYGSGVHIRHLIKEYGTINFKKEILDTADTIEKLRELEVYWIEKLDSANPDIGYNIRKTYHDKNNKNTKLTTVYINEHLLKQFKLRATERDFTFKQVVTDALHKIVSSSDVYKPSSGSI